MCGICGIYNFGNMEPVRPGLIERMKDTLIHRGPNDHGTYINNFIGLGHRRLSIIGVADGKQPLSNEDGSIWVTFNGEIYNHHHLRKWLESKGHFLRTKTDTEVLVHLYEEEGTEFIKKLRGMFSFGLWDTQNRRLLLARDRFGKKPLYYYCDHNRLIFASEIKAILQIETLPRTPNRLGIHHYLSLGYIPSPYSAFEKIHKLPAGTCMEVTPGKISGIRRYWDIKYDTDFKYDDQDMINMLDEKLDDSVEIRLESEVPLGVFLSGGVDSSAIAQRTSELLKDKVTSTTIRFEDPNFDESSYAQRAAQLLGTDHHSYSVQLKAGKLLEDILYYFDEPFSDSSALPTYILCKTSKKIVSVVLSGDGGDELFAGYNWYHQILNQHKFRKRFPTLCSTIIPRLLSIYPRYARGRSSLRGLMLTLPEAYAEMRFIFGSDEKKFLYREFLNECSDRVNDPEETYRRLFGQSGVNDPVSSAQYTDYSSYLTDDILVKVDRMSMANSLEVRSPLLDHELVELVARFPSNIKLKENDGKYIFKKLLLRSLPKELLFRKKQGFSVPLDSWLKNELQSFAYELLFDGQLEKRGYFHMNYLRQIWERQQKNTSWQTDLSHRIWTLIVLELWHRMYIDRSIGWNVASPMA